MVITIEDIIKRIKRFKGYEMYEKAIFWLQMTFQMEGPRAAMAHARRIEAAYKALRSDRIAKREEFRRNDATRRGLVIA